MRFRHFKRYYLELDYDWEKLRFLLSVLRRCFAGEGGAFRMTTRRSVKSHPGEVRTLRTLP
jgi:hypothetical protein